MIGTIAPPGVQNLTDDELTKLSNNLKLREEVREVFRAELAWRRLQEAIKRQAVPPEQVLRVQCRYCPNKFDVLLPKGVKLSAGVPVTCKECCEDRSAVDTPGTEIEKQLEGKSPAKQSQLRNTLASARKRFVKQPDGTFAEVDDYAPYRREKVKQTASEWRKSNPERAGEYKRRYRQGDSYVDSREELSSDAAWEAKLKEFDYACSTPGCGQSLTVETAIRSAAGPTYVPVCRSCLGKKAANERWKKEKRLGKL